MQGRLLPKYKGQYQAHPLGYWQKEFFLASSFGLNCIEFIIDYDDVAQNPLINKDGYKEILSLSVETGIQIDSVCADYFMSSPIFTKDKYKIKKNEKILLQILESAEKLDITNIVIPCVDQSTIQNKKNKDRFISIMKEYVSEAESKKINFALETDLDPYDFGRLLDSFSSNYVTVNYDIGNSASMGYDYKEELEIYGHRISDVHIKDRKYKGESVLLGTGDANIPGFFEHFLNFNYNGPFILQAYRDDEGLEVFKKQFKWLKENIKF